MRRKIAALAALILTMGALTALATPAAASACIGPGCDSGWAYAHCYNSGYGIDMYANDRTVWHANGVRTVYYSGYVTDHVLGNQTYDEVRIFSHIPPNGTWTLKLDSNYPPGYGSYDSTDFTVLNPGVAHQEQAHFRWAGAWCNAPVITE